MKLLISLISLEETKKWNLLIYLQFTINQIGVQIVFVFRLRLLVRNFLIQHIHIFSTKNMLTRQHDTPCFSYQALVESSKLLFQPSFCLWLRLRMCQLLRYCQSIEIKDTLKENFTTFKLVEASEISKNKLADIPLLLLLLNSITLIKIH